MIFLVDVTTVVIVSIIALIFLGIVFFILVSLLTKIKKDHVLVCMDALGNRKAFSQGIHFISPYRYQKVKEINIAETTIKGKIENYSLVITYKVEDPIKNSYKENTFSEELTKFESTERMQSDEYLIDGIKKIATDYGVDLIELSYKKG